MQPKALSSLLIAVISTLALVACSCNAQTPNAGLADVHTDVQYTQNSPAQFMDLYVPQGVAAALPAIVAIHGGGWRGGSRTGYRNAASHFVSHGYVFCTIDYRLDDTAIYPAQIEDCKCAIRYLRAHANLYHIDPSRIGVWGESAGGHLAAMLGTSAGVKRLEGTGGWEDQSSAVQAVLDLYGPSDLRAYGKTTAVSQAGADIVVKFLGGTPMDKPDLAADASPIVFVSKNSAPFLILQGDKDPLVSVAQSQELYDTLKASGVDATIKILPGAGHGGPQFFAPEIISMVDDFFARELKPAGQ
ncbi:MAG: alpha/beta hydrolase [Capsulimonadaceae bacterium]|nr:alpha/beta hydrolase [Capsulimonadaceae bacterium]